MTGDYSPEDFKRFDEIRQKVEAEGSAFDKLPPAEREAIVARAREKKRLAFAERFFNALDNDDRDPLPNEMACLKSFIEVKLPEVQKALTELAGATERAIPEPDLWDLLSRAHKNLKLAGQYAQRRLDYWKGHEDRKDAEEQKAWAERSRKSLERWFAENE